MLVEDCDRSRTPVRDNSPHFPVFEEFKGASYEPVDLDWALVLFTARRLMLIRRHFDSGNDHPPTLQATGTLPEGPLRPA